MRRSWLSVMTAVFAGACSGSAPPAPAAARAVAVEPTSCKDASAILRGPVLADDPQARAAREDAILRACEGDHWSTAVLACVGSERAPASCIAQLTEQQRESYTAKLGAWDALYGSTDDGGDGDAAAAADPRYTDCAELIDDVARYAPPYDPRTPERDWQTTARKQLVEATCNTAGWTEETKECLVAAKDPPTTDACLHAETSAAKLAQQLTELDATAAKLAAAKQQPAKISCAKAVAAHYADARWKDRLKDRKPAERRQLIAASRAAMTKACTTDQWSETTRACIVVADQQRCYDQAMRWGYPALIAAKASALPDDCATYQAAIEQISSCDSLPQSSRDAMRSAFEQAAATWAQLPPDELKAMGPACKAGAEAMLQAFAGCGGW